MNNSLPLVRKTNHIAKFRFHTEDTQNAIFDIIVNNIQIFQGIDENGEDCEYIYLHSKDGNIYKALLPKTDFMNISTEEERKQEKNDKNFNLFAIDRILSILKKNLYEHIDMIPSKMVGNIVMNIQEKHSKNFFIYEAFKCTKGWINSIYNYIDFIGKDSEIFFDEYITKEINTFNQYYKERVHSRSGRSEKSQPAYDDNLPGVTKEDISAGNDILRKMIAYLEEKKIKDELK